MGKSHCAGALGLKIIAEYARGISKAILTFPEISIDGHINELSNFKMVYGNFKHVGRGNN